MILTNGYAASQLAYEDYSKHFTRQARLQRIIRVGPKYAKID